MMLLYPHHKDCFLCSLLILSLWFIFAMCHVSNGWTGKTGGMLNGAYLDSLSWTTRLNGNTKLSMSFLSNWIQKLTIMSEPIYLTLFFCQEFIWLNLFYSLLSQFMIKFVFLLSIFFILAYHLSHFPLHANFFFDKQKWVIY
jgi:hypothetical protein